jgi:hypothetical protein
MIYLYIRQTVKDYARWKEGFDTHAAARQAAGVMREPFVMHNVDDPNDIIVLLGWCDLKQARLFSQSVSWQMAMQEMGVVGSPEVRFLEGVG